MANMIAASFAVLRFVALQLLDFCNISQVIQTAFENVQIPKYALDGFRTTLVMHGDKVCENLK